MDRIAASLEHHANALRIKKLLVAAYTGGWETDVERLSGYALAEVLQELMLSYPSLEQLQTALDAIVDTLNKKAEYVQVATLITEHVQPYYGDRQQEELQTDEEPTEVSEVTYPIIPASQPVAVVELYPQLSQPEAWFDLRWQIMKYLNPLKTKILLFSAVFHPFRGTNQHWLSLNNYLIDDLLAELFKTCGPLPAIEAKLRQTAQTLDQRDATGQHDLLVDSLIKLIQPVCKPQAQPTSHPKATCPPATPARELRSLDAQDEDLTCMFFAKDHQPTPASLGHGS